MLPLPCGWTFNWFFVKPAFGPFLTSKTRTVPNFVDGHEIEPDLDATDHDSHLASEDPEPLGLQFLDRALDTRLAHEYRTEAAQEPNGDAERQRGPVDADRDGAATAAAGTRAAVPQRVSPPRRRRPAISCALPGVPRDEVHAAARPASDAIRR
jgi:hypothetical protein